MRLDQLSGDILQQADSNPALRAVALANLRASSQIFEYAQFYSFLGNADLPKKAATEAGGSQRSVDSDYAAVTGSPTYGNVALQIFGDKLLTDIANERRGGNIESERVRELITFCSRMGKYFMYQIINGSGTPPQMHGLKNLIQAAQIFTLGGGSDGGYVPLGNSDTNKADQQAFLESLDNLINHAGAGAILIAGPKMISRLTAIAREHVLYTNVDGVFGLVAIYNGVPIVNAGYSKDLTTLVISETDTVGDSINNCTSIYAVRFGERQDVTIGTNVGLQVRDLGLVGTQYSTLVEMDADLTILNPLAAWKLQGIMLTQPT